MSISLDGLNNFQVGLDGSVVQYAATKTGAKSFSGYGTNYSSALNSDGSYRTNAQGRRLMAFRGEGVRGRFLKMAGLAAIAGFLVAGLFEYNFGDSEVVMAAYFAMALPFMGENIRAQATST